MTRIKILQNAINTYGETRQAHMIQEECLELALAIQKYQREQTIENYNRIIDEIADVKIMIEQAQIIFQIDKINERVEFKINRLNERLQHKI